MFKLEALSTVAKIGAPLEVQFAAPAFISKFSFRSLLQDRKLLADWRGGRFWAHALDHGPRIILDHLADQNAVGGKRARHHRNDDLGNAQRPVSYTHLRAHETRHDLVCRLL